MQIEFTVTGLKPTQRRRHKSANKHRPVPSVVQTIVLAYQIEQAVQDGRAKNYAEVAKQLGLTRARVSQIMRVLRLPASVIESLVLNGPGDRLEV